MTNINSISALLLLCVPAIVAGAEDTVAASSDSLTIAFEDISSITSSHPASTNLRGNEPTSKVQDVLVFFREYSYDDGEAEDYIELSLPIPVNVRSRSLKKEKKDKDKDKKGGGGGGSDKDKYDEIIAKYKAQQQKGASSTGTQQAQQTLQQQQGQQQYHNQPSAGTVISSGGGVLHISGGTIDLRGVRGTPSTTPAKRTCVEVPPIMGCDGGGADNQKMKFLNVDFGTCSNCDRGLFKVMPTKMAYYCPKYGRPACGGQCYDAAADGKIRDKVGGIWDANDPRFVNAEKESWGGLWPANFGCPSCI